MKWSTESPANATELEQAITFDPVVSFFSNSFENLPDRDGPASEFFKSIRRGDCRRQVEAIRERFNSAMARTNGDREAAKKAVAAQKKKLSCATLSGTVSIRAKDKLQTHSGLSQGDIDHLGGRKAEIREVLKRDRKSTRLNSSH